MKRAFLFATILLLSSSISYAQNRNITSSADPGELYITGSWYGIYNPILGPPYYDTLRTAIYRITENGKKLTKQYDANYFANPENVMQPSYILADVSSGVIYNRSDYSKNSYARTSLWVSFDYGKNWIFREEDIGGSGYYSVNVEGIIYRAYYLPFYESLDYGFTFSEIDYNPGGSEPGLQNGEGFSVWYTSKRLLRYSSDFGKNFIEFPIGEEFMFGQICGIFPDVYRGGLPGEVYVSSWFPDGSYKVSFSADTGHTFRHVYVANVFCDEPGRPVFMSDREPGVFYIVKSYEIEDTNPYGWHTKICVEYYRDYGATLEATFCHDIHKNYEYEEVPCENITHLTANVTQNSVQLQWTNTVNNSCIRGYHLYRNNERITNELLQEPAYIDKISYSGEYEYYVKTYYKEGCVSDSSNHVRANVTVGVKGVKELEGVRVWPNPTTGELFVQSSKFKVQGVEVFDIYGRKCHVSRVTRHENIDISDLSSGIYFVKILTDIGVVVKKVVKM